MEKSEIFDKILNRDLIDEQTLKKLSYAGIPSQYRFLVYKILLDILTRNRNFHKKQEENHKRRYLSFFRFNNELEDSSHCGDCNKCGDCNNCNNCNSSCNNTCNFCNNHSNSNSSNCNTHSNSNNSNCNNHSNSNSSNCNNHSNSNCSNGSNGNCISLNQDLSESSLTSEFASSITLGISNRNRSEFTCKDNSKEIKSNSNIQNTMTSGYHNDLSNIQDLKGQEYSPSEWVLAFHIPHIKSQISIDISRIALENRIYNGVDYSYIYSNILMITAVTRPLTEYIQGMADLIVPFFHLCIGMDDILLVESSIFYCFQKILNQIEASLQSLQCFSFAKITKILKFFDPLLLLYFEKNDIEISMFGTKWLHCIFIREFPLDQWYRIFDSMISSGLHEFLIFFTVALIRFLRLRILNKDGCESIILLQNLRNIEFSSGEIEILIGEVSYMRRLYI